MRRCFDVAAVLVPGLALSRDARLCPRLVLRGCHAAHHPLRHARRSRHRLCQARALERRARGDRDRKARAEECDDPRPHHRRPQPHRHDQRRRGDRGDLQLAGRRPVALRRPDQPRFPDGAGCGADVGGDDRALKLHDRRALRLCRPACAAFPVGEFWMATVFDDVRPVAAISRRAWRPLRILRELPTIPLAVVALLAFAAIFAPVIAPYSPLEPVSPTEEQCFARYGMASCPYLDDAPPFWSVEGSFATPLGTDFLGRDVLSRLIYGARISLLVALTGTVVAGAIGTILGVLAGYLGRWWDQIIMRITDAWLTLPSLVFAILISSVRGPGVWNVVLILALVFWSRYSRAVRGEVLALRERDFVRLAEINGISKTRIIARHLIPNVMNTVMVLFR